MSQTAQKPKQAAPEGATPAAAPAPGDGRTLDFIHDVKLKVTVEFGRSNLTIREILSLASGSVVELNKISGEPLDIRLNGKLVARGEAVIVNDRFGIRVTEIVSPEDFEAAMGTLAEK